MGLRNVEYMIQEAFTGIRRNGLMAFASVTTIALSLGVLGTFALLALAANRFVLSRVNQFEIAVFIEGKTLADIEPALKQIRGIPGVVDLKVRDRKKEWEAFKRDRPDFESAGVPLDVLPFAIDVKVSDPSRIAQIAAKIRLINGVDRVNESKELVDRILAVLRVIKVLSIAGVLVLLGTTALIISNAIRLTLYARRLEIKIMQLVGATNQFIRLPLVIEGVVLGAVGAILAWFFLTLGGKYVALMAEKIVFLGRISSGVGRAELACGLVVVGAMIGAAGSFVSIRRFLHD
ncbi:MAG: permease-like cell division protein FtsX [Armatimonadota bacterium]|nr:permease-like cell division protein FtsX [Armatimonadota bacterium]